MCHRKTRETKPPESDIMLTCCQLITSVPGLRTSERATSAAWAPLLRGPISYHAVATPQNNSVKDGATYQWKHAKFGYSPNWNSWTDCGSGVKNGQKVNELHSINKSTIVDMRSSRCWCQPRRKDAGTVNSEESFATSRKSLNKFRVNTSTKWKGRQLNRSYTRDNNEQNSVIQDLFGLVGNWSCIYYADIAIHFAQNTKQIHQYFHY